MATQEEMSRYVFVIHTPIIGKASVSKTATP
jgi:hypothetical protein